MIESCVYVIRNRINGKRYVGSTNDYHRRCKEHRGELCRGRHWNSQLQKDWIEYSEKNFVFEVLESMESFDMLASREQFWIDYYRGMLYNISIYANSYSNRGKPLSLETRRRMGLASKARWEDPIFRETMRKALNDPDRIEAISRSARVRWANPIFRRRMMGIHQSEEVKTKKSRVTTLRWRDPVYRDKVYAGLHTPECHTRLVTANKERWEDEEYSSKMYTMYKSAEFRDKCNAKPYPSFRNTETGEIIPAGVNLTRMCQECGLAIYGMWAIKTGRQKSSQGWILQEENIE